MALALLLTLLACGGGNSTTTTVSGAGINSLGQSPDVSLPFVQTDNNLLVQVSDGPRGFMAPNANILYATVTVCSPTDTSHCVSIDHVQVDTGSVGLRVLASLVKDLGLPPLQIASSPDPVRNAWECFPFVIGGLWGANATAVVGLGRQFTSPVAVQLIEDNTDANAALQAPDNCIAAADGNLLSSASSLGSNGILGIGSTNLDCGNVCLQGSYATDAQFVQYYSYAPGSTGKAQCASNMALCSSVVASVPVNLQVANPISNLQNSRYRDGVVLAMPAVGNPGAATATGELIFGVDSVVDANGLSGNTVPSGVTKVQLGADTNNLPAYLSITTQLMHGASPQTFIGSYLDTGTNGIFFTDSSSAALPLCAASSWYCPAGLTTLNAFLWDGGKAQPTQNSPWVSVPVQFQIGNAEALFSTSNTAFSGAAGTAPLTSTGQPDTTSFAWGMPFFYGKKVYMSIWDITSGSGATPWYAWTVL